MKCIAIIGKKRTGKTTKAVELIKSLEMPTFIFDINNEYTRKFGLKNDYKGKISMEEFQSNVMNKRNCCLVFEEAAPFLKRSNSVLIDIMQRSRHTNNVVILILHQIADLPRDLYGRIDYIVLFKTQDFQSTLDSKFRSNEDFMFNYQLVKDSDDSHFFSIFET